MVNSFDSQREQAGGTRLIDSSPAGMHGGSLSIGHRLPNLLESGLNCLKTALLTPGPSELCLEVSLYLLRVSLHQCILGGPTTPSECWPFSGPRGPGHWTYSLGCERKKCNEDSLGVRDAE